MEASIEHPEGWKLSFRDQEQVLKVFWNESAIATIALQAVFLAEPQAVSPTQGNLSCRVQGERLCCDQRVVLVLPQQVTIFVRDTLRFSADARLEWHRSWWHEEAHTLAPLELQAAVNVCGTLQSHLLPGLLYDGNHGAVAERLVPRLALGVPNLFEEHKYPIPFVHVACAIGTQDYGLTLEVTPCAVVDGQLPDQWWSLGLAVDPQTHQPTLLSRSGRLSLNGEEETMYCGQNQVMPYQGAWVHMRPHQVYEKHCCLHLQRVETPRQSWRLPLHRVLEAQPALTAEEVQQTSLSALEEAIALKVQYALGRWVEHADACGMDRWPHRPEFADPQRTYSWSRHRPGTVEYGWVGQQMRLNLALWRWGQSRQDHALMQHGLRGAETWRQAALRACANEQPVPTLYLAGEQRWCDTEGAGGGYARPTMETLYEFALFCRQVRQQEQPCLEWEASLHELLQWYAHPARRQPDGLFPLAWQEDGSVQEGPGVTAGVLFVAALAQASLLPRGEQWLPLAQEILEVYAARFLGEMPAHPCGSALDSGCEDMESGLFLLIAATRLAEAEQVHGQFQPERLFQARQAADWTLTWAYSWNVPMQMGTVLQAAGFSTRGWSDVSVQNRCLHVYSPAAELLRLARLLETHEQDAAAFYLQQAWRMLVPLVQTISRPAQRWGMDEPGEQTEQYNQTNYVQHPDDPVAQPRGGIARWFVPWITVWVLSTCLDFLDLADF